MNQMMMMMMMVVVVVVVMMMMIRFSSIKLWKEHVIPYQMITYKW
jgi:hypothetical protein